MRAHGFGIPLFATHTGVGTYLEQGKIIQKYDKKGTPIKFNRPRDVYHDDSGIPYLLEKSIGGDIGLIKAHKADL